MQKAKVLQTVEGRIRCGDGDLWRPARMNPALDHGARDARIVRRALRAGLVTWATLAIGLILAIRVVGLGGRAAVVVVMLALCLGSGMSSLWLLLALLLDGFADEQVSRRRLLWTAVVVVFTLASPMFVLFAQGPG